MAGIKTVKRAYTLECRDAVTKEVVKAVTYESCNAVYKTIDIHEVKAVYVPKTNGKNVHCIDSTKIVSAQKVNIDYVHTDISCYKKADKDLTIEELFKNI